MDLQRLSPIIEQIFKQVLSEERYPFGNPVKGLSNKIASGKLVNSIKAVQTDKNTILIYGPDDKPLNQTYGDWGGRGDVNLGRRPGLKGVPIEDLIEWIKLKGIVPRFSDEQRKLSFAIAINKKREKNGKHKIPIKVLIKWMSDKSIIPNYDPYRSMAFAIQKNIKTFGIKATNFIEISLDVIENNKELIEKVEQIAVEEIIDIIEGI